MIKQGVVQEKIADLTSMNHLPPLSTLPQWSRINTLDRGRYPKPFVRDKVPIYPEMSRKEDGEESKEVDLQELDPKQRIQHLERNMMFLKQQHQEVLQSLHAEIEGLKKENKDLQFKIIMSQKGQQQQQAEKRSASSRHSAKDTHHELTSRGYDKEYSSTSLFSQTLEYTSSAGRSREERIDELKVIFLEEEIKELKLALRDARNRNNYLSQLLEQAEDVKKKQQARIEMLQQQVSQGGGALAEQIAAGNLNPFSNQVRPPTLAECEAVIKHLQKVNENQAHELDGLKSDLRDVLYSHKWTPDAYLLAKAYIAEDDAKSAKEKSLPKVALKNPSRKLPEVAYINRETVTLPALKQTIGNQNVERKKRTQILQKARLRKEVIP
ncbi:coiled-coil domain-containing protein 74B-like isoform X1 [Ostrea edulis]|uniref:coiled-coil domain-containing protein 74B-like isoform X1 n=1 Tax=Ostrea edulis TaxID=37623 RepID=UPI0024AFA30F|nr:coiled-coil domain-containing protein 74B-like isoform X1 [Ostrea edulis]XP_048753463.2 coiled-coil domain-containing protein 74B-like isoform X1 [Ostrea edulis]XP_048753464.2 coiled-coil domain-containing protein 74B-like isoform X1 [Ostrea edulis]XP_056010453.1 coiled-coil domain-containing protein 74B-like isoform X1 [Ostrea edulis]